MRCWSILLSLGLLGCGGETQTQSSGSGGTNSGGGGVSSGATGGTGGSGASACTVVAAEELPAPAGPDATLTGPAIAATDSGFAIGYRDQSGTTLRAVLLYVSDAGVTGEPQHFDLSGCTSQVPTDGVGMAFASGQGLYASSLPNCGSGAGAVFIPFNALGEPGQAAGPRNAAFTDLTVAQSSSLANSAAPGEYELLYRVVTVSGPVVERVVLKGPDFDSIPIVHPFGESDLAWGMMATSSEVRAFLGPRPGLLELQVGPMQSVAVDSKGTLELPIADRNALTAWKSLVAVAQAAPSGPMLHVARLSGSTLEKLTEGTVGNGSYQGIDLALASTRLYVVGGLSGGVHLYGIPLQNEVPDLQTTWPRTDLTGADQPTLAGFDGRLVAARAARGKVLVTWLSAEKISGGPSGGWALLACNP